MRAINNVSKAARRIGLMSGVALIAISASVFGSSVAAAAAPATNQQIAEGQQSNSAPQWQKQKHGNSQQNGQGQWQQNGQGQNHQWSQNGQGQWQHNGQGQWQHNGQGQWQQNGQGQNHQW